MYVGSKLPFLSIHIYYFGDYDEKGLIIPLSAWRDIATWATALIINQGVEPDVAAKVLNYHRVGINEEHIEELGITENPERPGTDQWEALDDRQAEALIAKANELLDLAAFDEVEAREGDIAGRLRQRL